MILLIFKDILNILFYQYFLKLEKKNKNQKKTQRKPQNQIIFFDIFLYFLFLWL